MAIGPAPLLAALVGIANAAVFILLLGAERTRLVLLFPAAVLGAYAGQALALHLPDPLRIGDFGVLWAAGFAWLGILVVVLVGPIIGLQLPNALENVSKEATYWQLAGWGALVLGVVIVSRFVYVYPATYLPRMIPSIRRRDPPPPLRVPTVIGWAGMRGVVSIAAAVALPLTVDSGAAFPQRDLVVYLAFVVVVGTLVVQGFTLPWVIRRLHAAGTDETADLLAEAEAQQTAAAAAIDRLDALLAQEPEVDEDVVERLRTRTQGRAFTAWERLGGTDSPEAPTAAYRRLRRQMLATERDTFVRLRDAGRLDDEVLRRVHRELDLEEAMLARE